MKSMLVGHDVRTTRKMHWDNLKNGLLLRAATDGGFVAMITTDRRMQSSRTPPP